MKTKETTESTTTKKPLFQSKLKSLRPMGSLVKTRSFKPKTTVAGVMLKSEESEKRV